MTFYDLKSLLNRSIAHSGIKKQVDAVNVVELFNALAPRLLGVRLGKEVQALFIREGALTLQCTSSVVMQEVRYRERVVVNALNARLGREMVRQVRYTT